MRRLFLIAGLMTALGLAVVAASAFAPANFAGTWSLDKSKSQGLDPRMQNAESVTWTITQDDKQISIDSKVVAGPPPAGATGGPGGGGGGGMGGGRGPTGPRVFSLDGKEATAEAQAAPTRRRPPGRAMARPSSYRRFVPEAATARSSNSRPSKS